MRKVRVKLLKESFKKILAEGTKNQWRIFKRNYLKGLRCSIG